MMTMSERYPKSLVERYLKTSNKLKKFDRIFKRFGPNVSEVLEEYKRLSIKFEEGGIYDYAAMCQLGCSKCEKSVGNNISEVNSYLKSAWYFLKAEDNAAGLHHRSHQDIFIEGALKSYNLALSGIDHNDVLQAAVIREITMIQPKFETTSSFASPSHRMYDLQLSANKCLEEYDFVTALEKFTDILDNISERKKLHLYSELVNIEISRVLLLVILNLPPSRQSPSHIKLIEFFYNLGNFEEENESSITLFELNTENFFPPEIKYALSEIVIAWRDYNESLHVALEQLLECSSITSVHKFLVEQIMDKL